MVILKNPAWRLPSYAVIYLHRQQQHYSPGEKMGIFRYTDKYAAPTKEQRERYLTGKSEEYHFGPGGQIMLIEYYEAAYLKDDIDDIRILFTGFRDKQKAREETKQLIYRHEHREPDINLFKTTRTAGGDSKPADRKSG